MRIRSLGEMSRQLFLCGGVGFAAAAVVGLMMSLFSREYTVSGCYALGLSVSIVAVWIAMGVMNVNLI